MKNERSVMMHCEAWHGSTGWEGDTRDLSKAIRSHERSDFALLRTAHLSSSFHGSYQDERAVAVLQDEILVYGFLALRSTSCLKQHWVGDLPSVSHIFQVASSSTSTPIRTSGVNRPAA